MPAPRANRASREALVEFKGKSLPVRFHELTSEEDEELRDKAATVTEKGIDFRPFRYFGLRLRRMVEEIDGEPMSESSPVWLELDGDFKDQLRKVLFKEDEDFFRGGAKGAGGEAVG